MFGSIRKRAPLRGSSITAHYSNSWASKLPPGSPLPAPDTATRKMPLMFSRLTLGHMPLLDDQGAYVKAPVGSRIPTRS